MRGISLLLAVVAAALSVTSCEASRLPTGEIVFVRGRDSNQRLYVMRADGSHVRLLMHDATAPAVSLDGRRIAFVRGRAIWTMNRDGSHPRQVTQPGGGSEYGDDSPAWSPNGTVVYFSRWLDKSDASSIFSIRTDGTHLRRLTRDVGESDAHCQTGIAPSPDGRLIAYGESFRCRHGDSGFIAAITASGRPASLPFRFPASHVTTLLESDPAWSPDGRHLSYDVLDLEDWDNARKLGASGLYISTLHDGRPHRLSAAGYGATWAPDGKWIAFADPRGISLAHTDGSALRRLPHTTANDSQPAWLLSR